MKTILGNMAKMPSWEKARQAIKFEKDGLWGLKSPEGEVILEPTYDQIEFCADYIYVRYDDRYTLYYPNGSMSDSIVRDEDFEFYENGMMGLKNPDGSIFLPAEYDEVLDWGKHCDVIYARKGEEFHYYNHKHEEILTEYEHIKEDKEPHMPYSLGEDQHRNVLVCLEPIDKPEGDRDCFACDQWVRLSLIPYAQIRDIFANCDVVQMPEYALDHFEDKSTYIYSARIFSAFGEFPITQCIERIKTTWCYDASWWYLVKITMNSQTQLNPHDLYNAIKHYEDLDDCVEYHIAIAHDESLPIGEVRVFQVHYFWDGGPGFLDDEYLQTTMPSGSVEEVREGLEKFSPLEKKKFLVDAFHWVKFSEERTWDDTRAVLEYLKSQGCNDFTSEMRENIWINPYWMEEISLRQWVFKKLMIAWGGLNGGQLNPIREGLTPYDLFLKNLKRAKDHDDKSPEFMDSLKNADEFAEWLKDAGAVTAKEQREYVESHLDGLTPQEVIDFVAEA